MMNAIAIFSNTFLFMALVTLTLLLMTHAVCQRWFPRYPSSALSGSVIMVLALFVAECLPQYQFSVWPIRIAMLEVIVLWIYGSFSLLQDFYFSGATKKHAERFGLSAWITGTSLACIMAGKTNPLLHGAILLLMLFAILLWVKYLLMLIYGLTAYVRNHFDEYVSSLALLGPAATVSVAWMFYFVFQEKLPIIIYEAFIVLTCLMYVFVLIMLLNNFYKRKLPILFSGWSSENTLIFGVASLIGIVSMVTQAAPDSFIKMVWVGSITVGIISTVLDISNVILRNNIWVYDVKQWLRTFSYTALYLFSWYCYYQHYFDNAVIRLIVEYGLGVVTLLLLVQIVYACFTQKAAVYAGSDKLE